MSEHEIMPKQSKLSFWGKALFVAQIAGGFAAVGGLVIGLIMLGMSL